MIWEPAVVRTLGRDALAAGVVEVGAQSKSGERKVRAFQERALARPRLDCACQGLSLEVDCYVQLLLFTPEMAMRAAEWHKLPTSLTELCISTTLRCGQSFRYGMAFGVGI
jgi:hypothetical protein